MIETTLSDYACVSAFQLVQAYDQEIKVDLESHGVAYSVHTQKEIFGLLSSKEVAIIMNDEKDIVGLLIYEVKSATAEVVMLYVHPRYRMQGFGREAVNWMKSQGFTNVTSQQYMTPDGEGFAYSLNCVELSKRLAVF